MHEVRAEPLDHRTRSAGLETGEACQRTSHPPQLQVCSTCYGSGTAAPSGSHLPREGYPLKRNLVAEAPCPGQSDAEHQWGGVPRPHGNPPPQTPPSDREKFVLGLLADEKFSQAPLAQAGSFIGPKFSLAQTKTQHQWGGGLAQGLGISGGRGAGPPPPCLSEALGSMVFGAGGPFGLLPHLTIAQFSLPAVCACVCVRAREWSPIGCSAQRPSSSEMAVIREPNFLLWNTGESENGPVGHGLAI